MAKTRDGYIDLRSTTDTASRYGGPFYSVEFDNFMLISLRSLVDEFDARYSAFGKEAPKGLEEDVARVRRLVDLIEGGGATNG